MRVSESWEGRKQPEHVDKLLIYSLEEIMELMQTFLIVAGVTILNLTILLVAVTVNK